MAGRVLKVYLAASMRGGGNGKGWDALEQLARIVEGLGHVPLNEVRKGTAPKAKVKGTGDRYLYNRDMAWIAMADCLIADVTYPSLGVGYEIASALRVHKIPVLGLYDGSLPELSAMINGNTEQMIKLERYASSEDIERSVRRFLGKIAKLKQ